jgi:hypothetical protein
LQNERQNVGVATATYNPLKQGAPLLRIIRKY